MRLVRHALGIAALTIVLFCAISQAGVGRMAQALHLQAEPPAPALQQAGRVTDAANVLTSQQKSKLNGMLARFERGTKQQLVVVTVPSLGGRDIADFTRDLANSWGVGRKEHNDGVVLLVAPQERKVRIAVGYGLEKRLPNAICSEIIEHEMIPRFKEGDIPSGIEAGTNSLIAYLK
jgi:uncharacterized protein